MMDSIIRESRWLGRSRQVRAVNAAIGQQRLAALRASALVSSKTLTALI
jgi:hypothetical protein